jgi:hypothetical protein
MGVTPLGKEAGRELGDVITEQAHCKVQYGTPIQYVSNNLAVRLESQRNC